MCELQIMENAGRIRKTPAKPLQKGTFNSEKYQEDCHIGMHCGVRCRDAVQLREQEGSGLDFSRKPYLCPYCGRIMLKKTMQVDHIVSISLANKHRAYRVLVPDGNINNLHNLTASCPKCNNRKSDSGGFWIFLARFGVVFYAVIWLLLLGFAAWFAIGAATGHIQRGFLLPYFSAAGNVLMQGTANAIASIFRFH